MAELNDKNAPTERELLEAVAEMKEMNSAIAESNSIVAVALMRVYDVLMCMYGEQDSTDAIKLRDEHEAGKLRSNIPWLSGNNDG